MTSITDAFALAVSANWFHITDLSTRPASSVYWQMKGAGKFQLSLDRGSYVDFNEEAAAWRVVVSHMPTALDMLQRSGRISEWGLARRGELLVTLGQEAVESMTARMRADVLRIYRVALDVLKATRVNKSAPTVRRVSAAKAVSWLEVRANVKLPGSSGPELLSVRCLPSPVESNTWAVRLRFGAPTADCLLDTHQRLDELVSRLASEGIVAKDVLNGTCFDI